MSVLTWIRAFRRTFANTREMGEPKNLLIVAAILLVIAPLLEAQDASFDDSWRWVQFTTESGLPSNNVYDVIETPDSTLWAVCDAGIAWYDGFQWHPVQLPAAELPEGKSPPCDYRGDSILIGLDTGEWYAVGRHGSLKLPVPQHCRLTYISGDTILGLKDESLFFLIRDLGQLRPLSLHFVSGGYESFRRTKEGRVWITTMDGLRRWENNEWRMIFKFDELPTTEYLLTENSAGSVFALFTLPISLRGMWEYLPESRITRRVPDGAGDIQAIALSPSNELMAASSFGEVRIYTGTSWQTSAVLQSKCKGLHTLFFRGNGDLVITTNEGIHYFTNASSRWRLLQDGKPETGAVNEILATRSGNIWLGTANGLIHYGKNGRSKKITHVNGAPMVAITGLEEDREGNIWVSSGGAFDGAYRWNGSTWKHFQISQNKDGARFHKIRKDRSGRLWFLGLSKFLGDPNVEEPGAFVYDNGQFTSWRKLRGFPNARAFAFEEDAEGGLWFATQAGILRWKDGAWRRWTTAEGLRHDRVFTLTVDRELNAWFGHQASGLGLGCITSSGQIRYFTTAEGLVNDYVWEVRVDSKGMVWIATRGGLASYSDGVWSRYDELTGLQSNSLWPVLPLDDDVYVGTHGKGVAILSRRESVLPPPRVVIDRPNIEGQDVHLSWRAYAFWGAKPPSEIITRYQIDDNPWTEWSTAHEVNLRGFPAGQHTIAVEARGLFGDSKEGIQRVTFTVLPLLFLRPAVLVPTSLLGLGLIALGVVLFQRKRQYNAGLRQREAKFRAVTELTSSAIFIYDQSRIHFMNSSAETITGYRLGGAATLSMNDLILPEDGETFLTHCLHADGSASQRTRCEIRIMTHHGDTRWLDFTSGPMSYQGQEMRLGTAFDITERKVADERLRSLTSELISTEERERRRVAIFLHDVIGQALALCKMKIRAMQKSGTSAGEDPGLQEVLRLVDDSIKNTRSLTFDLSPPVLHELSFPIALRSLIEQLLDQHSIHLEFGYNGTPIVLSDETRVIAYHVVREVVTNCIKHAQASTVSMCLEVRDSTLLIVVTDNGIGFNADHSPASQGFGLFNVRERLKGLGGSLEISSRDGRGTRVAISIPMSIPTTESNEHHSNHENTHHTGRRS